MRKKNRKIQDTLSDFGISWAKPYYVSSDLDLATVSKQSLRIDYCIFAICTNGHINIKVEEDYILVEKGTILLINSPALVKLKDYDTELKFKILFFEKKFLLKHFADPFILDRLFSAIDGKSRQVKTTKTDSDKIIKLLDHIEAKSYSQAKYEEAIIQASIFLLLLETAETLSSQEPLNLKFEHTKAPNIYFHFLELVKENVLEHRDVQFYLDYLHVTNQNLILAVRKGGGKTPHEVISEALIQEAIIMMNNPDISISEIAFALNFNSVASFSRFFKKATDISPTDYRKGNN